MPCFNQLDGLCYLNGNWIDVRDAHAHVMDHALHYASSVFEGERAYNGHIFKLTEHNARLRRSAEILDFEIQESVAELDDIARTLIKKNNFSTCYVRPVAWRGSPETMSISANGCPTQIALITFELPNYFKPHVLEKGVRLQTAKWKRPSPETAPHDAKAAGLYMIASLSKQKAEQQGFDDCLMYDYRGYVAESSTSNFFMVRDGEIHTSIADCFLDGLTRQTVIKLAKGLGYTLHERRIMPEELATADEMFLTGTAVEVMGIGQLDEKTYEVGPITKKLRKAYLEMAHSGMTSDTCAA